MAIPGFLLRIAKIDQFEFFVHGFSPDVGLKATNNCTDTITCSRFRHRINTNRSLLQRKCRLLFLIQVGIHSELMYIYVNKDEDTAIVRSDIENPFGATASHSGGATPSFDTLRAYDEAEYQLDERERWLDDPSYTARPYCGSLLLTEARLPSAGRSGNALLSMAAGYIYLRLCDSSSGLLKRHIPYCYKAGRFHGRREGKYLRWDMRLHAHGREALVEKLERRIWEYEEERFDSLLTQWDAASHSAVYFVEEAGYHGPTTHIVFSDKCLLERVHSHSLLEDCHALEQPDNLLQNAIAAERTLLSRYVAAQYAAVTDIHEPNVIPLPQRYKLLRSAP